MNLQISVTLSKESRDRICVRWIWQLLNDWNKHDLSSSLNYTSHDLDTCMRNTMWNVGSNAHLRDDHLYDCIATPLHTGRLHIFGQSSRAQLFFQNSFWWRWPKNLKSKSFFLLTCTMHIECCDVMWKMIYTRVTCCVLYWKTSFKSCAVVFHTLHRTSSRR